jgi:DNA-binding GntR family transcriptional regulator
MDGMVVKPSRVPYLEVAEKIRAEIRSGHLAPGDRVEPLRALAVKYDVAQGTVGGAMEVLRAEGLIETLQGKGSFVVAIPAADPAASEMETRLRGEIDELRREVAELRDDVERLEVKVTPVRRGGRQGGAGTALAEEVR